MRTKTLLIAAAALAAGLVASQAQTVYSANVVGYANVVIAGNGEYTLMANPLDDGNGNQLTNILSSALPKQSQVLLWTGTGYTSFTRGGTPPAWGSTTSLPPGIGFFVKNGVAGAPAITNTFVGSVVVNAGSSITNSEAVGYTLQGSPIPYAGNLAISGQNGGDTNMDFGGPLAKQSQILTWDPVSNYSSATKGGTPALWGSTVTIGVGQGFFIYNKNGPAANAVETFNP
jgi:hypothetical protein